MLRRVCFATLLAVGCFGERAPTTDCPEGEPGCPCGPSGCDPGLECAAEIDLCIPENCIPGSELCTCSDGLCLTGLVCDGTLCRPGEGGGTLEPTTEGSTLATTSTITTETSSSTGSSLGGAACRVCIAENNAPGGTCELAFAACSSSPGCTELEQCVDACIAADDPACIPACCTEHAAGAATYTAVGSCNANVCGLVCEDFGLFCPT